MVALSRSLFAEGSRSIMKSFLIRTQAWVLLLALVIFGFDQVSKRLILSSFEVGEILPIIPGFFNFTLVMNPGAAFGMFAGLPDFERRVVLWAVTVFALLFIFYLLKKDAKDDRVAEFGLALILGGALGNIWDRYFYDAVVDFLDVYVSSYHWPAFNIADSSIFIGVALLFLRFAKAPNPNENTLQESNT